MGKSSSNDELTIRNQFDRICKLALKGEAADYYRHIAYRQKHEVLFSELSQKELDSIFGVDKYTVENKCFRVLGYDIEVKDTLLAEAIQSLSENKRKVVLLSYFMDMSDAEIAREITLCAVPSMNIGNAHSNYSNKLWRQIRMRKNHSQVYRSAGSDCTEE